MARSGKVCGQRLTTRSSRPASACITSSHPLRVNLIFLPASREPVLRTLRRGQSPSASPSVAPRFFRYPVPACLLERPFLPLPLHAQLPGAVSLPYPSLVLRLQPQQLWWMLGVAVGVAARALSHGCTRGRFAHAPRDRTRFARLPTRPRDGSASTDTRLGPVHRKGRFRTRSI